MAAAHDPALMAELGKAAREMAAVQPSPAAAQRALSIRFDTVDRQTIDDVYAAALRGVGDNLFLLNRSNWNQIQRIDRLLGCDEGQGIVRLQVSITDLDADSGHTRHFMHVEFDTRSAARSSRGRVRDQVEDAIGIAWQDAEDRSYGMRRPGVSQRSGALRYTIHRVDCY